MQLDSLWHEGNMFFGGLFKIAFILSILCDHRWTSCAKDPLVPSGLYSHSILGRMSDIAALITIYSISHIPRAGLRVCPIYREGQKQTLKCGNNMLALQGGPSPAFIRWRRNWRKLILSNGSSLITMISCPWRSVTKSPSHRDISSLDRVSSPHRDRPLHSVSTSRWHLTALGGGNLETQTNPHSPHPPLAPLCNVDPFVICIMVISRGYKN